MSTFNSKLAAALALLGSASLAHELNSRADQSNREHQTYAGIRSYVTAAGTILFESPLALELVTDSQNRVLTERLTSPPDFGPAQAEKQLYADGQGGFSIRFTNVDGTGYATLAPGSTLDWNLSASQWPSQQMSWDFVIPSLDRHVSGTGTFSHESIRVSGEVRNEKGKTQIRYRERYWAIDTAEYKRVRDAILKDEDPELTPPDMPR